MVFCYEHWRKQKEINEQHGSALKKIEESLVLKDNAISHLLENDATHDVKLLRHEDMINSLTECVSSIKETNQEIKAFHTENSKYFKTIAENMITVKVFTHNIKWFAGIMAAITVIWKAIEFLIHSI